MLSNKYAVWLKKVGQRIAGQSPGGIKGEQTALERKTGIAQDQFSTYFKEVRANVTLERFEHIAESLCPKLELWEALKAVCEERDPAPQGLDPEAWLEERYRDSFSAIFRGHPRRAAHVIANMEHQERLGYTELISDVVRLIIEKGPSDAAGKVAARLGQHAETPSTQLTKLRNQLRREFLDLEEMGKALESERIH